MKKAALILCTLGLLFWVALDAVYAEEEIPEHFKIPTTMHCGSIDAIYGVLRKYDEIPFVLGDITIQTPDGKFWSGEMEIIVNPDSGTYSIIGIFEDEIACIIALGDRFRPAPWGIQL